MMNSHENGNNDRDLPPDPIIMLPVVDLDHVFSIWKDEHFGHETFTVENVERVDSTSPTIPVIVTGIVRGVASVPGRDRPDGRTNGRHQFVTSWHSLCAGYLDRWFACPSLTTFRDFEVLTEILWAKPEPVWEAVAEARSRYDAGGAQSATASTVLGSLDTQARNLIGALSVGGVHEPRATVTLLDLLHRAHPKTPSVAAAAFLDPSITAQNVTKKLVDGMDETSMRAYVEGVRFVHSLAK